MSAFPKSAVGLISLFIFVTWLVFMMGINEISSPLASVNDMTTSVINNLGNASQNIISGNEGLFGFGVISSFFSLIWNLLLIPLLFVVQIFVTFATFISIMTFLPLELSGIILVLIGVGLVLSLLRFIIPE